MARPTLDEWARTLEAAARSGLRAELVRQLVTAAFAGEAAAKEAATTRLRVRTGRLRNSIRGTVRAGSDGPEIVLRAGGDEGTRSVRYAALQELGGTVRATRSRYLAIPLGPAQTAAGVSRYPSAKWDPTPMHVRPSKDGRLFLFPDAGGPPRYRLKESVKITGKGYLMAGVLAAQKELPEAIEAAIRTVVQP